MSSPSQGRVHVKVRGRTIGPVSLEQLERLLRRGEVELTDSVRDESGTWCRLSEFETLFPPEQSIDEGQAATGQSLGAEGGPGAEVARPSVGPPGPADSPKPLTPGPLPPHPVGDPRPRPVGWIIGGGVVTVLVIVGLFFALSGNGNSGGSEVGEADGGDSVASVEVPGPNPNPATAAVPPQDAAGDAAAKTTRDDEPGRSQPEDDKSTAEVTPRVAPSKPQASPGKKKPTAKPTTAAKPKPAVSKDGAGRKRSQSAPPYVVKRFLDLRDTTGTRGRRLALASLPGSPASVADVTDLSLVGAGLMDDLVETESGDEGRSLLVRGRVPDDDACATGSATRLVSVVRFEVDAKGVGCTWTDDKDVVKRFLPQLRWCGLSLRVGGDQVHYVGLRKPVEYKPPLPRLKYKGQEYRLALRLDQLTDKVAAQLAIDGARIESRGQPLCRIVTSGTGNRGVSFSLDDVRRFKADRGKVDLLIERDDDLQRFFLRIRLEPEWDGLRSDFRDERKELGRVSSVARFAFSTATKSGGKRLAMSSNEGLRSLVEDTLKLDTPDADASPSDFAEFARQVASGATKVVKANDARIKRLLRDEKELELSRKQLIDAVVRLRLHTRLRHRGTTILIPRLSL